MGDVLAKTIPGTASCSIYHSMLMGMHNPIRWYSYTRDIFVLISHIIRMGYHGWIIAQFATPGYQVAGIVKILQLFDRVNSVLKMI